MAVNRDKPDRWKPDIAQSVDLYNDWFLTFAPDAFRTERVKATAQVKQALEWTRNLTDVSAEMLKSHPEVLPFLRMSTCPPIARDRLIGLSGVPSSMVLCMEIQAVLDNAKSQSDRNRLGQFATPTALAMDVLQLALGALGDDKEIRFLDPALGTGAFFSALLSIVPSERIQTAEGYEIDPHYGLPSQKLWKHTPLQVYITDFTQVVQPSEQRLYNLIICNPPYVRHHHLAVMDKSRLQRDCETASGIRMNGLAGLYCYFMGLAHAWMQENAVAAWLIPTEFMDVNYGRQVKQYLLEKVTLLRIHRFDPHQVQFDDALVSSAVVLFRCALPPKGHTVEFTFGGSLLNPAVSNMVRSSDLQPVAKWTGLGLRGFKEHSEGLKLADLFSIRRGLATGANHFFIITGQQAIEYGLPGEFLRPILPSPRYLHSDEVEADTVGNPTLERQLFLLDCNLPAERIKVDYPRLWKYLETGMPSVSERYLCRGREPWYSQERRQPAPLLCTYMGRSDTKSSRPFRFILNHSKAIAANIYLMLYPKPLLTHALKNDPDLLRRIWESLNTLPADALIDEGRIYGGGLHKMEPKELANVPMASIADHIPLDIKKSVSLQLAFGDLS